MDCNSKEAAWSLVNKLFPTDYEKDERSSARAGYDIYRFRGDWCPAEFANNWISDLGNRLEVNLSSGKSINVWIKVTKPEFTEGEIADTLRVINDTIYSIDDLISGKIQEKTGINKARELMYAAYKVLAVELKRDYPNSKLYQQYNLKDA